MQVGGLRSTCTAFAWADFNTHAVLGARAVVYHGRPSPESALASANHRHDVPSATSDVPSATSNPNDDDGCACGDAGGPSALASSAPPPLL